MSATLLDGRRVAEKVKSRVAEQVVKFQERHDRPPALTVVRVGDDPASEVYVRGKRRDAESVGIRADEIHMKAETSADELHDVIGELNEDDEVDGVLLQLPLPPHLDDRPFLFEIDPAKDVDGFHPENVGRLVTGSPTVLPCTPAGIMELLTDAGVPISGRRAVVIGRSNIVGKPMALLLLAADATVTVCHSKTRDLPDVCREADILVVAAGRAGMVRGDWLKPGAAVVDVGMNRIEGRRLVGDVAFQEAEPRAAFITPVPGGVGPMTRAMLMQNTLAAAENRLAARRRAEVGSRQITERERRRRHERPGTERSQPTRSPGR